MAIINASQILENIKIPIRSIKSDISSMLSCCSSVRTSDFVFVSLGSSGTIFAQTPHADT